MERYCLAREEERAEVVGEVTVKVTRIKSSNIIIIETSNIDAKILTITQTKQIKPIKITQITKIKTKHKKTKNINQQKQTLNPTPYIITLKIQSTPTFIRQIQTKTITKISNCIIVGY